MTDPMIPQFWAKEDDLLWEIVAALYIATFLEGVVSGAEQLPDELQPLVNVEAFNGIASTYARQYRHTLINRINDTTQEGAQRTVFEWMQDNTDTLTLAALLALLFSDARARMIARTEVTRIFALGAAAVWQTVGVRKVRWNTAQDERVCPVCAPRDRRVYFIGNLGEYPPIHRNCRCWIEPVIDLENVR